MVKAVIVPNCFIGGKIAKNKTPNPKTVVIAAPKRAEPVFFTVLLMALSSE